MDLPDTQQLAHVMSQSTAPAFVLGAVAGFVSILLGRMTTIVDRIRSLNEISEDDSARAHLRSDIPRLQRRGQPLEQCCTPSSAQWDVHGVVARRRICERISQVAARIRSRDSFGIALGLLGASLFKFSEEVGIGLSEADHYR
jgi:hypothetical protein